MTWGTAIFVTWTADRANDRSIHIMCLLLVSAVGNAIVASTMSVGARFFGMFLVSQTRKPTQPIPSSHTN